MRYYAFQNETKAYLNRLERENGLRISGTVAKSLNDRVELLKKSGVWARYGLGFNDVDGDAYLARANVTNVMGRGEVLWFVRGMKALGLYSNMVAWPLIKRQNIGTGSTAYGIGGLSSSTITLVNSPVWGSDGVICSGGTDYTKANALGVVNTEFTVINCFTKISNNVAQGQNQLWCLLSSNASGFMNIVSGNTIYGSGTGGGVINGGAVSPNNILGVYQCSFKSGNLFLIANSSSEIGGVSGTTVFAFPNTDILFGQAFTARYFNHTQHAQIVFNKKCSSPDLRTLLLNTLLYGLP